MIYTSNAFVTALQAYPPEQVVLIDGKKAIKAGELLLQSIKTAEWLRKKGVQVGDRVVIAAPPGLDFIRIVYANMLLRTVMAIIDPEMGRENYAAKLRQFEPHHAIVDSRLVLLNEHPVLKFFLLRWRKNVPVFPVVKNCTLFTVGYRLPIFRSHFQVPVQFPGPDPIFQLKSGDEQEGFLVTYTSGTLSEPKGVLHAYSGLKSSLGHLSSQLKAGGSERIATHLPHFMLLGVVAGLKVFLWDNNLPAKEKLEFIREHHITTLFGPPSDYLPLIQYCQAQNILLPDCLRDIWLGSAPVFPSFLQKLLAVLGKARITCLYGMTENLMVCYQDGKEKAAYQGEGDLVGRPFPGVNIALAEDGEIGVDSDQRFLHYWKMESIGGPHKSGDLGALDEQGRLVLYGRKKDMIIRGNFNIYPGLYEPTINRIPGITEAVMIGRYSEIKEDEAIILVVETAQKMDAGALLKQLQSGLHSIDKDAWPDEIIFRTLPRSGRQNKVNRVLLRKELSR